MLYIIHRINKDYKNNLYKVIKYLTMVLRLICNNLHTAQIFTSVYLLNLIHKYSNTYLLFSNTSVKYNN